MTTQEKAARIARAALRCTPTPFERRLVVRALEEIEVEEREEEFAEIERHYQPEMAGDGHVSD